MKRQTVVETPSYIALASKLFGEREHENIVAMVAEDPECGDLISGTGGFRKVRVPRCRYGKEWRGASRVYLAQRQISGLSHYCLREKRKGQFDQGRA